jgi:hypothetical protein
VFQDADALKADTDEGRALLAEVEHTCILAFSCAALSTFFIDAFVVVYA